MTKTSSDNNDNVVVIKPNSNAANKETNQPETLNAATKNNAIILRLQVKIFATLLMTFAALLFLALVSHTSSDTANLQLKFFDWFGIFSGNPSIKIKFDTTFNWLSLFGAFMSDLLINRTIGVWIIGTPVFLFIWGWKYYKYNEIPNTTIVKTIYYLVAAFIVACLFGSLSNFSSLQDMSLAFYGVIGAFIGTTISNIISPVGASILMSLLLLLFVAKTTNMKQKGILNVIKSFVNFLNINRLFSFINDITKRENQNQEQEPEIKDNEKEVQNATNNNDVLTTNTAVPVINTEPVYAENIFLADQFLNHSYPQSAPIQSNNAVVDDNLFDNFVSLNELNKENIKEVHQQDNTIIQKELVPDIAPKTATIIDEAVFTFEPPANINLPPQKIYPTAPIDLSNETVIYNPLSNNDLQNDTTSEEDFDETEKPDYHQPIKIDLNNKSNSTMQMSKAVSHEAQAGMSSFRNPLSIEIHDEAINYISPTLNLLKIIEDKNIVSNEELHKNGRILQEKLQTFKIDISDLTATRGPVVTQYEFVPADGVKLNKIEVLADDLAMALKTKSVIISPLPEKGSVGIQIPNSNPSIVSFRSVVESGSFQQSHYELPLALGKTVSGEPYIADLAKMPHLLMAGATGSGKSVGINTIIASLLYKKKPHQLKFIIVDPKKVELSQYTRLSNHFIATLPNLNSEIVTDPKDAVTILKSAVLEMEKRYTILEAAKQRNIKDYNEKVRSAAFQNDTNIDHREFPYIVVIIDELADLMLTAGKEVEKPIVRLAQMARAVGIHLIIATQRPSVNVITGIIKANFPARIAYLVAQKIDSRVILDDNGAEALLGNGDMLFNSANQKALRIQSPFISTDEVESICDFIGNQEGYSAPYFLPFVSEASGEENSTTLDINGVDPLFYEAAELVIGLKMASISGLQRSLKIGFARAGRIIDELAKFKVIGPQQGSKARTVLVESINEIKINK